MASTFSRDIRASVGQRHAPCHTTVALFARVGFFTNLLFEDGVGRQRRHQAVALLIDFDRAGVPKVSGQMSRARTPNAATVVDELTARLPQG
jgi:hypothetical protein